MYQGIFYQSASSRIIESKAQTPLQIHFVHTLVGRYNEENLCASSVIAFEQNGG